MLKVLLPLLLSVSAFTFAQTTVPLLPGERIPDGEYAVNRVKDGDTYVVTHEGVARSVRPLGIDTPEVRRAQFYATEATAFATALLTGRTVTLEVGEPAVDPFGRLLATVYLHGEDVSLALAQGGYAEVYEPSTPEIRAAVAGAKSVHKGRWQTMSGKRFDRNCVNFATQDEAQAFFLGAQDIARDIHRLDSNNDGLACNRAFGL